METVLTLKNDSSREEVMKKIDELRKTELYPILQKTVIKYAKEEDVRTFG